MALALVLLAGCREAAPRPPPHTKGPPAGAAAAAPSPPRKPSGFLGVILAPQTVDVAAQLAGRVTEVRVRPGDRVEEGATLARLDARAARSELAMAHANVLAARAELQRAELELEQARARHARRAAVVEVAGGAVPTVSGEELATAEYDEKVAAVRVSAARAALLEKQAHDQELKVAAAERRVRAPFAGIVTLRYVDSGTTVHTGAPIVRLIEATDLRVRFAVPEKQADAVALGDRVQVRGDGVALEGRVDKIAPEIDTAARAVFVEAALPGEASARARLRSGQAVRVAVERTLARSR